MKPEQKMAITFSVYGAVMGVFSALFRILALDFLVPIAGYCAMVFVAKKFAGGKNLKWLIFSSLPSFVLVWFTAWILVFNIR